MDRIKILIAEPDKKIQQLYNEIFVDAIFEKSIVPDGKQCLALYEKNTPDIVMLEMRLPLLPGYGIIRTIRNTLKDHNTIIIAISDNPDTSEEKSCREIGVEEYIRKPIAKGSIAIRILEAYGAKHPEPIKKLIEYYLLYFAGLAKLNILDVISHYTDLKADGKNHIGIVPIKGFMEQIIVHPHEKEFYIPKLDQKGNVFNFIQLVKNITPLEALEYLRPHISQK